jgi:hypothetical protein
MFAPQFRLVPAHDYLRFFASNRSHMQKNGAWLSPPPTWPCIGDGHNLDQFIDMNNQRYGSIYSLPQLKIFFQIQQ